LVALIPRLLIRSLAGEPPATTLTGEDLGFLVWILFAVFHGGFEVLDAFS
jgi:hypothetical protein